jgi:hypothetical protein
MKSRLYPHLALIAVISLLTLGVIDIAQAAQYAPGETLNPNCFPIDSNCTVSTSTLSLLATANTFTNTNTFNAAGIFNAGLTANTLSVANLALNLNSTITVGGNTLLDSSGNIDAVVLPLQDTAVNLSAVQPLSGQMVYETDTKFTKIGDGSTTAGNLSPIALWLSNGTGSNAWFLNGNVGIGTTSPYAPLSVVGQVLATNFNATSTTATSTIFGYLAIGTSTTMYNGRSTQFYIGGPNSSLDQTGGGANPSNALAVFGQNANAGSGNTAGSIILQSGNGVGSHSNHGSNGGSVTIVAGGAGAGVTAVAGTAGVVNITGGYAGGGDTTPSPGGNVYINGGGLTTGATTPGNVILANLQGNVGIGTTSPYAPLSVNGQIVGAYFTATTSTASSFPYASTTMITATTASSTNLFLSSLGLNQIPYATTAGQLTGSSNLTFNGTTLTANALSLTSALTVANGGTGATSFGQGWLNSDGTTITSSTSPTVNYITATSTTATSTFGFDLLLNRDIGFASGANRNIYINQSTGAGNSFLFGLPTGAGNGTAGGGTTFNLGAGASRTSGVGNGGAAGTFTITGAAGGNASAATGGGTNQGGAGGGFTFTGGDGGTAGNSGGQGASGGAGGALNLTAGNGGIITAKSGNTNSPGVGGNLYLTAGNGASGVSAGVGGGTGGILKIQAGTGGDAGSGNVGGNGSPLQFYLGSGGSSNTLSSGTNNGGNGSLTSFTLGVGGAASNASTTVGGNGANINFTAPVGGSATGGANDVSARGGIGGNITLTAGQGGTANGTIPGANQTAGAAGAISLLAGSGGATATGGTGKNGGAINLTAGDGSNVSGATNNGGNIYLLPGAGSPSGTAGNVILGSNAAGVIRGNVGIGTTSPQGLLDVVGSSNSISTAFDGSRAMSIINTNTTNGNMAGFDYRTNDANGVLTTGAKIMAIFNSHAAGAVSSDLAFRVNNAGIIGEAMRITAAGNVGIGTTSPWANLSVVGNSDLGNSALAGYFTATSTTATSTFAGGLTAGGSTGLSVLQNGNVGIGTASPISPLNTVSNIITNPVVAITNSNTDTSNNVTTIGLKVTGATVQGYHGTAYSYAQYVQGGAAINSQGNQFSYGTYIQGGNAGTGGYSYGLYVLPGSGAGSNYAASFGGKVGIGTTTPLSTLTVTGSGCFSEGAGATALCSTTAGTVTADVFNTQAADVAEDYVASDPSISAGDIIAFDPTNPLHIIKAAGSLRPTGVISTDPGLILGGADGSIQGPSVRPVALSGRVPTKVSLEGGPIAIGDSIALSSVPGVGKKASGNGDVIGIALEPYTDSSGAGLINVFVNLRQNIDLSQFDLNIATTTQSIANISMSLTDIASSLINNDSTLSALGTRVDALSSTTAALQSSLATSTIASSTASALTANQSFIGMIASAVANLIQSAGNWAVNQITATLAIFTDVKTSSISVTNGIEMTDQATGEVYCVQIRNGSFVNTPGTCSASSTPAISNTAPSQASSTNQPQNINIQAPNINQSVGSSSQASTTITAAIATTTTTSATSTTPITTASSTSATSTINIATTTDTIIPVQPQIPPTPTTSPSATSTSVTPASDSADNQSVSSDATTATSTP